MAQAVRRTRRSPDVHGGRRIATSVAVAISVVVSLYLVVSLLVLPRLRINRIVVRADFDMDKSELLSLAGLEGNERYFEFDPAAVEAALESNGRIRSAHVSKSFPNQVTIVLTHRRPIVTVIHAPADTPALVGTVDEEGVLFAACHPGEAPPNLPILSGIAFDSFHVGTRLPEVLVPMLTNLYDLRMDRPDLFALLSEVEVIPLRGGGYDARLFLRNHTIPVLTSNEIDDHVATYALMVLDALQREGLAASVSELDFRAGEVVYRLKEGTRGQ